MERVAVQKYALHCTLDFYTFLSVKTMSALIIVRNRTSVDSKFNPKTDWINLNQNSYVKTIIHMDVWSENQIRNGVS